VVIPGCQFIKEMKQAISIRYANIRITINFIENTRIGTLRTMHLFKKRQLLGRLLIEITSRTGSHELRTWDIAPSHA
jgi:hypothetical protein